MKVSKYSKNSTVNLLDPEKLLTWGDSQLKKIEKLSKGKKSLSEDINCSKQNKKRKHLNEDSYEEEKVNKETFKQEEEINSSKLKKKRKHLIEDSYEEKKMVRKTHKRKKSVNDNTEIEENRDVIYANKGKKRKKDKHELLSVNIELKKDDVSYETNFSYTNKKKGKKRNEIDEVKKVKKKKNDNTDLNKNKNEIGESCCIEHIRKKLLSDVNKILEDENINNISLSNKKGKRKKSKSVSETGETDYPKKRKRKEKLNNSEVDNYSDDISVYKTDLDEPSCTRRHDRAEKKKIKEDTIIEMEQIPNEKKKKKQKETVIDIEQITNEKKKKKKKETVIVMEQITNEKKKKKKKEIYIDVEQVSNEEENKKKKKKKKDKSKENCDDDENSLSASFISSCSYRSEKNSKMGKNFGKSPISMLLSNHDLNHTCCGVNTVCCRKACNNTSITETSNNSAVPETDTSVSNEKVAEPNIIFPVIIKQEKIHTEVQNHLPTNKAMSQEEIGYAHSSTSIKNQEKISEVSLPPNIIIKQEKIDETQDIMPNNICKDIFQNLNVKIKQEVPFVPSESMVSHDKIRETISDLNITTNGNITENVEHDNKCNTFVCSSSITAENTNITAKNECSKENPILLTHLESNKQFFTDNCEAYYNLYDDKITIREEIGFCSAVPNDSDTVSQIKMENCNTLLQSNILQAEPSCVNSEVNISHPNQNVDTAKCISNINDLSKEQMSHLCPAQNFNIMQSISNANDFATEVSHGTSSITENTSENHIQINDTKNIFKNSENLDFIPLPDIADSGMCNEVDLEKDRKLYMVQNKHDRFHSEEHYHDLNKNERHNKNKEHNKHKENNPSIHNHKMNHNRSNHHSWSMNKTLLFNCVRPQFKMKEQVSRLLHVDISQVVFCYYRVNSKFYQDVHVKFSSRRHFQNVLDHYVKRVNCKSWHVKEEEKKK